MKADCVLKSQEHITVFTHPLRLLWRGKLNKNRATEVLAAEVAPHADTAELSSLAKEVCR